MTKPKPTRAVQISVNVVIDGILDAETMYYLLPFDKLEEIKQILDKVKEGG